MPATRSTQPRWVTEPTIKPTLAPPRHSRMPTCTRCIGCCERAAEDMTSEAAATAARMRERGMESLRLKRCDASTDHDGATALALRSLWHNGGGGARIYLTQHVIPGRE